MRVLVAQGNEVNQQVALGMLANLGYPADLVSNGHEMLRVLEQRYGHQHAGNARSGGHPQHHRALQGPAVTSDRRADSPCHEG